MKSPRNWPLTYEEPDWNPLEAALTPEQREDSIYMSQAGPIVLYKHRWTRWYLNIRLGGVTFFRHSDAVYEEIDCSDALDFVRA